MKTVRAKLVALVFACVAPAIIGAVLRAREAEQDMLEQVERRVNFVNKNFANQLDEYQANARLALSLADHAQKFQQAVANHDAASAQRLVKLLGDLYKYRIVLVSDDKGVILAGANAARAPKSLDASSSDAFPELLAGKPLSGMIALQYADGPGYALVSGTPVLSDGKQVGAVVLLTPITSKYLEYLEPKLNADLSLRVNEKVVAACADHPDPNLESHTENAVLKEAGGKLFALKTFRPEKLQRPNMEVELTASRDVTALRDENRKDLLQSLGVLAALLVVVLAIALRFASRMGHAIRDISSAAEQIPKGKYVTVPELKSGDEIQALGVSFNQMVQGLKERDQLKDTFGRYVTRQIADHLMRGNVALGGQLVPVTVLFSDIRSFTTISERMEPRALLDFLNEYFSGMVESVMQHHGVVDKFIGDAIMAVFGAPVPAQDDPLHAVKAALEMRTRLQRINVHFRERGLPEIRTGIGLHSGMVVAGNMGHEQRMEYTVIGDTVNLASRLESMTKELHADVIVSEDLYLQVKDAVEVEPLRKIKVKGREQEVMVYKLLGLKGEVTPSSPPGSPTAAA